MPSSERISESLVPPPFGNRTMLIKLSTLAFSTPGCSILARIESGAGKFASNERSAPSSVLASRSISAMRLTENERTAVNAAIPTVMAEMKSTNLARLRRLSRQAIFRIKDIGTVYGIRCTVYGARCFTPNHEIHAGLWLCQKKPIKSANQKTGSRNFTVLCKKPNLNDRRVWNFGADGRQEDLFRGCRHSRRKYSARS